MSKKIESVCMAVIQASPIIMDKEATVNKTVGLINDAAKMGADIIVFPEAFIPCYPRGLTFGTLVGSRSKKGRTDWKRYLKNSVSVPGKTVDILSKAAKEANAYVSIGVTERDNEFSGGTLYCSILFFGPDGTFLGKHRKLKPTASERLIWGEGDGSTLTIVETPYGRMGSLICWENYMPLARTAMYAKGVDLYLAPTADSRNEWQCTLRHIAIEGRCFVIGCNQFITKDMYPTDLACYDELTSSPELMCRGGSAIIDPMGRYVAGPIFGKEDMIIAHLDLGLITEGRFDLDTVGHYSRPDVFKLIVDEKKKDPVEWDSLTKV
ncbi:MAG: carbon-nitrogen hydrolase family protein [Firmicutes bacterium]|nr:carbon-nitrogen hydrolase family protein [Bacillota bacterium]